MEERIYQTPETEVVELISESFICQSDSLPGGQGGTDDITPGGDD